MRNARADEFNRHLRSPTCSRGAHEDCPHLSGFGYGPNLRRLRLEVGQTLCKCECHSSCPVTSNRITIPAHIWRESCSCPGAEAERALRDRARTRAQHHSQAQKDAMEAVRARAAGKSREQIKDLYEAELHARGLDIPPEDILDAHVSLIKGEHLAAARFFGRSLVGLAKLFNVVNRPPR